MKRSYWILCFLAIVAVFIAACGRGTPSPTPAGAPAPASPTPTPSPPPVAAPAPARQLHFFLLNAFTGQSAPYGTRAAQGAKVRGKQINDAGGLVDKCGNRYTVRFTEFDMANSREQAVTGFRTAEADPTVLVVLGPSPSVGFVPILPVAGQMKMPFIAAGSAAAVTEWHPYAFRPNAVQSMATGLYMKRLEEKYDLKRVGVLYDITNDGLRPAAETARDLAGKIGYEIVAYEAMRAGDVDFRPQITKIKALNPDWVFIAMTMDEGAKAINQMDELGLLGKARLLTTMGQFNDVRYWDLTEGKIKDGMSWSSGFSVADPDPEMQKFRAEYRSMFNDEPTEFSIYGVQGMDAAVDAVKRSCTATDREAFRDALGDTDIRSLGGTITFKSPRSAPVGDNQNPLIVIARVTGRGAFEEVK